jgi:hypothetical protein
LLDDHVPQLAISSKVRAQPTHSPSVAISQILTQGVSLDDGVCAIGDAAGRLKFITELSQASSLTPQ